MFYQQFLTKKNSIIVFKPAKKEKTHWIESLCQTRDTNSNHFDQQWPCFPDGQKVKLTNWTEILLQGTEPSIKHWNEQWFPDKQKSKNRNELNYFAEQEAPTSNTAKNFAKKNWATKNGIH